MCALLIPAQALAQSQTRSPGAGGDCTNQAGIGTVAWGNPARAISSNNSYATRSLDGTTSNYLRCLNYGFTIPAGATILGIEVNVERRSNSTGNGGSRDAAMRLVKGGAIQATDRATATTYTTADVVEAHGSPTDLWGTTWTPAEVNAANFGAAFAATKPNAAGGGHTVSVDHIEITVHYSFTNNAPPAPALISPADGAVVNTATPTFNWSAAVDPDGHAVTYDIQVDDSGCGFASSEVNQTGLAGTSFVPGAALANATYCWRVRAVDEFGAAGPWSATRSFTINAPLSQTRSPGAGGDCTNQAGVGTVAWGNTGNAISSNNSYATRSLDGTTSNYLRCLNYGFTIPAGATILGIEVNVERRSNSTGNGGSRDAAMRLVKGGAIQATDRATATTYTTADVVEAHGSPTDLWGTTWTPAEINAVDFGAAFAAIKPNAAGGAHTVSVDHISITVYYAMPPPVTNPGGFNAYDAATAPADAITGFIRTKVAGAAISVDIIALNVARTAIEPGFGGAVRVELLDAGNNSGALDPATGCRGSWTLIQTVSPDPVFAAGDKGRRNVSFTEANAHRQARIRVSFPAGSPTVSGCSSDAFAIRPAAFANFSASDDDWDSPGTTRALTNLNVPGGVVHKAGQPFSLRATAVNAAGTPAVTTNYDGTPDVALSACAGSACAGSPGTLALGAAFSGGQLVSDAASYDEAGALRVRLVDDDFATVDAGDGSTPAERNIESAQLDVGRFVPDRFDVSYNLPVLETACGSGGKGFTYLGQRFNYILDPVISITAREAGGSATENYTGALWQITNASLTGKSYSAAAGSLDSSGVPGTDPAIVDTGTGTGTLTFGSGGGLRFTRPSAPLAPFDAEISLAINVIDADGVAFASNPARFGQASAGNGIAFNDGKLMRFGRLAATNARGSPLVPLTLNLELQYWNGSAFVTNTLDTCTTLAANNIEMTNFTQELGACETSLTVGPFAGGRAIARLSAPGGSNVGSVQLVPRLEQAVSGTPQVCIGGAQQPVTGANLPHLEGRWDVVDEGADGQLYDDNPAAQGTFGGYRGRREVIDIRENF